MGSPLFQTYTRTLRRMYWSDLIDRQVRLSNPRPMPASLVINPYTGLAILAEGEVEGVALRAGR